MTVVDSYDWCAKYYAGRGGYKVLWLVVHDMEAPEAPTTAESVARYFRTSGVAASAHYCLDNNSIVQCVHVGDRAWHAGTTANRHGIGYELAGYASQSPAQWGDAFSTATIANLARIMAEDAQQFGITPRLLTDAQVAGKSMTGITTHAQLSRVFRETTHTDPGSGFPLDALPSLVAAVMGGVPLKPPVPPIPPTKPTGDDVLNADDKAWLTAATTAIVRNEFDRYWGLPVGAHGPGGAAPWNARQLLQAAGIAGANMNDAARAAVLAPDPAPEQPGPADPATLTGDPDSPAPEHEV